MHYAKLWLSLAAGLVLIAPGGVKAQSSDSEARRSSDYGNEYSRWNDDASNRPRSLLPFTSYGYVGASIGESHLDLGNCTPGLVCDNQGDAFKVFAGGKLSRIVGLELGYVNLGNADRSGGQIEAQGANLSLVVNLPLGDYFNVYGKAGGIYGWTESNSTVPGIASGDEEGFNWSYGAGVQLDFNRHWAIVADWDHYRFDYVDRRDDANLYSVGLVYKF